MVYVSTFDQLPDERGRVTSVMFQQGNTADPEQRAGVAHGAFMPADSAGKVFPRYQLRRSVEFRLVGLYDWPLWLRGRPLPDGWSMHATALRQRYYRHKEHGSTFKHPLVYPEHADRFAHLHLPVCFHPPTTENPIFV
jgi:hypothetical protein